MRSSCSRYSFTVRHLLTVHTQSQPHVWLVRFVQSISRQFLPVFMGHCKYEQAYSFSAPCTAGPFGTSVRMGCWLLAAWLRAIPIHNAARRSTGLCCRECGAAFGIRSAGAQKPDLAGRWRWRWRPVLCLVSFDNKFNSARPPHTVETIVGPCSFARRSRRCRR